jgi:hypothetical protein
MFRKSQTTTEFMLIIGGILVIFIPLFYLMVSYSFESSDAITASQSRQVAGKISDEAREIYYLGLFSREILTVNMPDRVIAMNSFIIDKPGLNDEHYLNISFYKKEGTTSVLLPTEVPIITGDCVSAACTGCHICHFNKSFYTEGVRHIRLETVAWGDRLVVNATQVFI